MPKLSLRRALPRKKLVKRYVNKEGSPNGYGTALEMRREQSLRGSTPLPSAMTRVVDLRKKTEKKEITPVVERVSLVEKKTDIKVVVNKDAKIAEQIINQTVSRFQ